MLKRSSRGWACLVIIFIGLIGRDVNLVTIQFDSAGDLTASDNRPPSLVQLPQESNQRRQPIGSSGPPLESSSSSNHPLEHSLTENEKSESNQARISSTDEDDDHDDDEDEKENSQLPVGNVTILKRMRKKWIAESHNKRLVNETILGEEHLVRLEASNGGIIHSTKAINRELRKKFHAKLDSSIMTHVDRIYYINLDRRHLKRAIMESWLSQQDIPYARVAGKDGQPDTCVPKKEGPRCVGISGLAQTNLFIMDHLETEGITLVVEDDFVIRDMNKLLASVQLVPPDWDVLRWDCWDKPFPHFTRHPFSFQVAPVHQRMCTNVKQCWFCGGTHVVMWRGGKSLEKLRRLWGTPPHDGIDCLLTDPSIKTYCIQIGVGEFHFPLVEPSDIPK